LFAHARDLSSVGRKLKENQNSVVDDEPVKITRLSWEICDHTGVNPINNPPRNRNIAFYRSHTFSKTILVMASRRLEGFFRRGTVIVCDACHVRF
jgi:hypothetical protein